MLRTMSHEMIHTAKQMSPGYFERYSDFIFDNFLSENADELIFRRQRQYEKANNGKKLSYNEAMEEVVADASEMFLKGFLGLKVELGNQAGEGRVDMETVTEDLQKPKYKGVLRVLGNVIERMKRKISAFKRAWNGAQAKTEEGKTVSAGDAKAYEQAQQMFNELILRASANYKLLKDGKWESDSEKSEKASIRGGAEGGAEITEKDIAVLRDIPRKSINNFTSEEIQKTEVWAKRFYQELGTKSPYFRAWFGDWRAKDKSKVSIISVPTIDISQATLEHGYYSVDDTGWSVYAGKTLNDDTRHHSGGNRVNVKSLNAIDLILKNAVLLDTVVSENDTNKKSANTAFLHKLYTLIQYDGRQYIAKVTVEEYYNESKKGVDRRAYNLKAIKIEPAGGQLGISSSSSRPVTDSTISISNLFEIVKTYDKEISPKPVNPALLNEDGTPKVVYHGTNSEFWSFDLTQSGKNYEGTSEGFFFFTSEKSGYPDSAQDYARSHSQKYGGRERIIPAYLHMEKPLSLDSKGYYTPTAYFDSHADEIYEKYLQGDYDGVIIENSNKNADTSVIYLLDDATRIKSATDNIGTFDSDNPDIRYSTREEEVDSEERKVYNRKGAYKRISKEEYAIISGRIMEDNSKYMARNQKLPRYGTARSADYFYLYENFTPGNFGVLKQIKITDANRELIASVEARKGENNGVQTFGSAGKSNRLLEFLETQSRGSNSNNAIDSKGRTNRKNGEISLGESESNGIGSSREGVRNKRIENSLREESYPRTFADSLTEPTKYQTRDGSTTDYVTSRLALADAFEQIATNQRERNWAARYRERAEELAGYNARLRELWKDYFTKGHSAAERAEIRTQIRSLTQKIQTADGGGSKEKQGVKNTLFLNLQAAYSSDL